MTSSDSAATTATTTDPAAAPAGPTGPAPARSRRAPRKPRDRVRKTSFTQALNNALDLAMEKHPEMFLIGEDIAETGGDFGVTKGLPAKYGAELSARISEECFGDLRGPVVRVDGLDTPIPFSVPLEHVVLPGEADITTAIKKAAGY